MVVPGVSAACGVEWVGCTGCWSSCARTTLSRPNYPITPTPNPTTGPTQVFRPPNPWVMAILALLVEVYNLDNIKTGLKFEVRAQLGGSGSGVGGSRQGGLGCWACSRVQQAEGQLRLHPPGLAHLKPFHPPA